MHRVLHPPVLRDSQLYGVRAQALHPMPASNSSSAGNSLVHLQGAVGQEHDGGEQLLAAQEPRYRYRQQLASSAALQARQGSVLAVFTFTK